MKQCEHQQVPGTDELAIWEASRELSCDEVVIVTDNLEESTAIMETLL